PSCAVSFTSLLSRLFSNDPATTAIYTLSLHDALPIFGIAHDNQRMPDCPHVLIAEVHEASDCRMLVRHSHASGSNGDRATRGARHVPGRCGSSCCDRTRNVARKSTT